MSVTSQRLDLSGVYPPIATPFNTDESIAWDKLAHNMAKWTQEPIRGFLVQVLFTREKDE
jgi:4-hydroxy-2-oxoglutarate aldolase